MEFSKIYCTLYLLMIFWCSCTKTDTPDPHPGVDLYVAGSGTSNTDPHNSVGKIWINEKETDLETSTFGFPYPAEFATSITLSGNDIYVTGFGETGRSAFSGLNYLAKYWKNGVSVNITSNETTAYANSIAVSGTDVYVAFSESRLGLLHYLVARYWKNGITISLTDSTTSSNANAIAVSGSDVYVAGSEGNFAKYWKNGASVLLTDGSSLAAAYSMVLNGSDIYLAGNDGNRAVYWKNQIPIYLTDGSTASYAFSIIVDGSDIWVAGNIEQKAVYWKNGELNTVADDAHLYGMAIAGGNLFFVGYMNGSPPPATLWMNDKTLGLSDVSANTQLEGILAVKK